MNDDEIPERWPDEPNRIPGEPGRRTRIRARRAVAAVRAALAGISQSRGMFAVIGAAVATSIFVLFSALPGGHSLLQPPPTVTDRAENVGPGEGSTGNGAAPAGPDGDAPPARSALPSSQAVGPQAAGPQASPTESPAGEPAPAEPIPGQPDPPPDQPAPEDPTPEQPTPRTPSTPGVLQEKTVRMSTRTGQDSVEIDRWRKRNSESHDLRMDQDGLVTMLGAKLSVIDAPHATVTYQDCAQRTTWATRVDFTALHPGSTLCARSHTGRHAMLTVIALPRPAKPDSRFVFHATTWRLPGQQPSPRQTPPSQPPSAAPSAQPMAVAAPSAQPMAAAQRAK